MKFTELLIFAKIISTLMIIVALAIFVLGIADLVGKIGWGYSPISCIISASILLVAVAIRVFSKRALRNARE
jgi:hypothetical protein